MRKSKSVRKRSPRKEWLHDYLIKLIAGILGAIITWGVRHILGN
jgi:hypothetical protein